MDFKAMPSALSGLVTSRAGRSGGTPHIVDQLIAERTKGLASHPVWPLLRPALYRFLHYGQAVRMADEIAPLPGWDVLENISRLLEIDLRVAGAHHIPAEGGFILACSHPTGIADGIAVFDMLKRLRRDLAIFANRDALRVSPRLGDIIIPVEWRPDGKSHAKSRDTLERTARAFAENKCVVLFPSGRIAFWNRDHLEERPWQASLVALARRYRVPVVPVSVAARNSGFFYLASRKSPELRDMTVFHELLNKKGKTFTLNVGAPVSPDALDGDAAEITRRLQHHTAVALRDDADAVFGA